MVESIEVVDVSERDTGKACCVCGKEDDNQRGGRGLYACEACGAASNADGNGAENICLVLVAVRSYSDSPPRGGEFRQFGTATSINGSEESSSESSANMGGGGCRSHGGVLIPLGAWDARVRRDRHVQRTDGVVGVPFLVDQFADDTVLVHVERGVGGDDGPEAAA